MATKPKPPQQPKEKQQQEVPVVPPKIAEKVETTKVVKTESGLIITHH